MRIDQLMPTEYIEFNLGNRYSAEGHLGNEFGSHNDLLRRFKKKGAFKCTDQYPCGVCADSPYPISKFFASTFLLNLIKKQALRVNGQTLISVCPKNASIYGSARRVGYGEAMTSLLLASHRLRILEFVYDLRKRTICKHYCCLK